MPSKSSSLPEGTAEPNSNPTLFHSGPVKVAPSLSPFVLKLETYLRITEIPYNVEFSPKLSSKGKLPYIRHNSTDLCDTNFIIPYLNKTYEKNLDANLSDNDKAISRAFQKMAEENTYWTLIYYRYLESHGILAKQTPLTGFRKKMYLLQLNVQLKPRHNANLMGQGMGRHTKEEVHEILEKDLKAFSTYLDEKTYFMGDEPTEIDAFLFSLFACFCYTLPDTIHEKMCKETYPNIFAYTERIREKYWPDWEEKCFHDKKKEEETEGKKEEEAKVEEEGAGDAKKPEQAEEKQEVKEEQNGDNKTEDDKPEKIEEAVDNKEAEKPANGEGGSPEK